MAGGASAERLSLSPPGWAETRSQCLTTARVPWMVSHLMATSVERVPMGLVREISRSPRRL
ncbi:hypothetical protein LEMLEM_LOCUS25769 [Lemmus lemmus]